MGLIYWWMLLIWVALGFTVGFIVIKRKTNGRSNAIVSKPVAHTKRLRGLPEYQRALKHYRWLVRGALALLILALLSSMLLTSRPATMSVVTPAQRNRDIMLCLDVSGSVIETDIAVVEQFEQLVKNFSGQRFGLTIFNSSAISKIPLTDDYQLIQEELKNAKNGIKDVRDNIKYDYTAGTTAGYSRGSSLVGDGLASCVIHLGENDTHRSQSVILATDNEVSGKPIATTAQAATLAKQKNIRVYAIDPGSSSDSAFSGGSGDDHAKLKSYAEQTGGKYFNAQDAGLVNNIIGEISKQEATYFAGKSELSSTDAPMIPVIVMTITTLGALAILWRLRL